MNNYIQNKLDEFMEKYPNMQSENDEYTAIPTVELIEQALTDYHNHIVEKVKEKYKFSSSTTLFEILSILQDNATQSNGDKSNE